MSYQVLARKWRPQNFQEMVGQEHVLKALSNALDQDRLHHAYLFTGTRGVGKTTVARIFAKSLNCETGVTSQPCGQCVVCTEIAEGRFVDLIEIDAASRTKVEDMRELLDNVQYAPTRSRFKIYLIDEVHMLSNSSFNALLKTLEEPPPHIKFLLATTDPQKLPVTILSRCLQFNLKNLSPERIVRHLQKVLKAEQVEAEEAALWELAKSAEGSMRDALSLTDQAIAYGNGVLKNTDVLEMLGTIEKHVVLDLVQLIAQGDGAEVLAKVEHIAEFSPDYAYILQAMAELLHRVAIEQCVPGGIDNSFGDQRQVQELAQAMTPEDSQLFYQIALVNRKDLVLTPDPRVGFEMALLRMLTFKPNIQSGQEVNRSAASSGQKQQTATAPEDIDQDGEPERQSVTINPVKSPVTATSADSSSSRRSQVESSQPDVKPGASVRHPKDSETVVEQSNTPDAAKALPSAKAPSDSEIGGKSDQPADSVQQNTDSAITEVISGSGEIGSTGDTNTSLPDSGETDADAFVEVKKSPEFSLVNQNNPDAVPLEEYAAWVGEAEEVDIGEDPILPISEAAMAAVAETSSDATDQNEFFGAANSSEPLLTGKTWSEVLPQLQLTGMTLSLAQRCVLEEALGQRLEFVIDADHVDFFTAMQRNRLAAALSEFLGKNVTLDVRVGASKWLSPLQRAENRRAALQAEAEDEIKNDPNILRMMEAFDATLVAESIEPVLKD